jgi:hypothetical protein
MTISHCFLQGTNIAIVVMGYSVFFHNQAVPTFSCSAFCSAQQFLEASTGLFSGSLIFTGPNKLFSSPSKRIDRLPNKNKLSGQAHHRSRIPRSVLINLFKQRQLRSRVSPKVGLAIERCGAYNFSHPLVHIARD